MADTVTTAPPVVFKKRATKSTARKRAATPPPTSDTDSDLTSSEDENGRQIKRRRTIGTITATTKTSRTFTDTTGTPSTDADHISAKVVQPPSNADNATKSSDWFDTEHEKPQVLQPSAAQTQSEGIYHGTVAYKSFIRKPSDHQLQPNPSRTVGPQKLNSNVRSITVTDFAPDVCKDYKQTGFCGFGDSCKFLHAREDYKKGWQLDRDWEVTTKHKPPVGRTIASANRQSRANDADANADPNEEDEKLLESIPFACIICKNPYTSPIVTKCGHYFCEACALKRYSRSPSCAACGAGTGGVFNVARRLERLLERKREREARKVDGAT